MDYHAKWKSSSSFYFQFRFRELQYQFFNYFSLLSKLLFHIQSFYLCSSISIQLIVFVNFSLDIIIKYLVSKRLAIYKLWILCLKIPYFRASNILETKIQQYFLKQKLVVLNSQQIRFLFVLMPTINLFKYHQNHLWKF